MRERVGDSAELLELLSWSDEELLQAYTEADERISREISTASVVDIEMTNEGFVTINFIPKIHFPSYVIRRA